MIPQLAFPQAPLGELIHGPASADRIVRVADSDLVYGVSAVGDGGRIADKHLLAALRWRPGIRVNVTATDGGTLMIAPMPANRIRPECPSSTTTAARVEEPGRPCFPVTEEITEHRGWTGAPRAAVGCDTGKMVCIQYAVVVTDAWKHRPTLSGEHVRLEPLDAEHAEGLYEAGSDPAIWTWLAVGQPDDVEGMHGIIDKALADGTRLAWAQVDTKSGEVAGTTSFYQIDANNRILSIGHTWIGKRWQRTPLNSEAKLLMLRHAFEELGAHRVSLETDIRNEASQRANERLGAQREGVLRAHRIRPDGTLRDTVVFSVIAEEWAAVAEKLVERINR
jgi:N-acetyltransferase